ncbi:MAG: hypothetical protein ACD_12C00046G0002 [uncultured bacterium]|nr:MAG: hypothetical protein ACD_12C00046G0002 [uncultured bacterium]
MPNPSFFTTVINSNLPEPQASLLNGILFGVNLKTSKLFYQQLKIVGLLHIVVLSGTNITLLSSLITSITRSFSKHLSMALSILTIILFILFVGPQAPIIRAGFMGVLTSVSILTGRKQMILYCLVLSVLFIAIFWPQWLKTISFQLSYGATLGIVLFGSVREGEAKGWLAKLKLIIWKDLKTSLAAQVFTAPIIFLYFKQVSIIAPISNLLVSFLISPLMILGFLTAILGKINFWLGAVPAYLAYGILTYIVFIVEALAKLPLVFFSF